MNIAMAVATSATKSDTRAPYTTRLNTSRPSGSAPKMLSLLGPFGVPNESRYFVDCWSGGRAPTSSTICGAKIATSTRNTMNTSAAIATLSLRSRRQNSSNGDRASISLVADTPPPGAGPRAPASPPSSDRSGTPVVTEYLLSTRRAAGPSTGWRAARILPPAPRASLLLRQRCVAQVPGGVRLAHNRFHVRRLDQRRLVPVPRDRGRRAGHLLVDRRPRLRARARVGQYLRLGHRAVDGRVVQLR